ncbi:MAG: biopolymer transporter ExbD, partial [Pseudomonadota bacterium]
VNAVLRTKFRDRGEAGHQCLRRDSLPQEPAEPLVVSVQADGTVFIQEQAVSAETLMARLAAIAELRAEDRVYVRAAGEVVHARVAEVMGALSAAGFRRIALVNEQRSPDGG